MATHLSRRDLKQDAFSARVQGSVISLTQHKREVVRYGGIALAVILVAAGVWYFRSAQTSVRQQALGEAMTVYTGTIGGTPAPGVPNYPTEAAKDDAVIKAFTKITRDYSGSSEAYIAEYYLAGKSSDAGKVDEARKQYQDVVDHANADESALAKFALAQVDLSANHVAEGQALLKDLMDHPSDLVSKNQATLTYAKSIAATNSDEARKLLIQVAAQGSDGAQQASAAMAELPRK